MKFKAARSSLLSLAAFASLSSLTMCAAGADAISRPASTLSDAQIVRIVHTANDGEIRQAELAEKRSLDPAVQSFAKMMVDQHRQVNEELRKVAKEERINPQNSSDASSLRHDADSAYSGLKTKQGAYFDQAYVDAQVQAHQEVLDSIDQTLLPNAKTAGLRAMLQKMRPEVETHLQHAKKLQVQLATALPTG